jgi:glycosyltransferase involved in cell wall biosynthesis
MLTKTLNKPISFTSVPFLKQRTVDFNYEFSTSPKVVILLCTFQGQDFLAEQLDSFAAQTYCNWQVCASDDASTDKTQSILQAYKRKWPVNRLSIYAGPANGFAANFLSITCRESVVSDYYAYSDQDDIWEADKLARAVEWLETIPQHIPALYCSRTCLVDAENKEIFLSPLFSKPASFANALMQNMGGGNTMVFNHAARALLCEAGEKITVISHDWWAYLVVTGCGGKVFYDPIPSVRYRQHRHNLVGTNATMSGRFKRLSMLWEGHYRHCNDCNIAELNKLQHQLTPENRMLLNRFAEVRKMNLMSRLLHFKSLGIYRQTRLGNLGLIAAAIFRKI